MSLKKIARNRHRVCRYSDTTFPFNCRLPFTIFFRSKKFHTSFIYTVKPRLTATSVIRSPRYYGHFLGPPVKNRHTFSLKKKTVVNTATPLIGPNFFWPISDRINGVPLYKNYIGQFLSACFLGIFTLYRKGFAPA